MILENNNIGKFIGIITKIIDDKNLYFITNNNSKCNISDIVGIKVNEKYFVLAQVSEVKIDFYLENSSQYFISKSVDNNIEKLTDSSHKPRFGQYITAKILGYYSLSSSGDLLEIKNKISNYTPSVLQKVYLI